jgi:hypothetical protein
MLISLIILELCPGQSSKFQNEQRKITPKLGKTELWFFNNALLRNEISLPTKFHVDISYTFKIMSRTKFKVLTWTKGNNSKNRQGRVTVLMHCTPTQWNLSNYKVSCWYLLLFQTYNPDKKKRTDGQTDKAATICSPFGEHNKIVLFRKISVDVRFIIKIFYK